MQEKQKKNEIIDFIKNVFPILKIDIKNKGIFNKTIAVPIGIFNK